MREKIAEGYNIPLEASGIPNGTRMENLLGTTPAVEARQGALEIELRPTPPRSIGERPQVTEPAV